MSNLSGKTTIVVGASRGLGHAIATAFTEAGATVIGVSRSPAALPEAANSATTIHLEIADASDATVPAVLPDRYEPVAIVLVAGATCLWSHAGRVPVHIHYLVQPVTAEQMAEFEAHGPSLQVAMASRGKTPQESEIQRVADQARQAFASD
jgi:NAD(P)-dependent dehydrogenase (short-subunit alcohol dehydrogenase family)